jgi:sigma-E factor negative regulatory protein RseA
MTQDMTTHELVSALADGQLRGEEFACALQRVEDDAEARARWHAYHLVGDVLRADELARTGGQDAAFVARLRLRLQQEQTPDLSVGALEPVASAADEVVAAGTHPVADAAANDASRRWKLVAGVASLAAVVAVGWQMAAFYGAADGGAQLAQAGAPGQQVMLRDPRLDQLLAAHQQFGGTSALQMPAGFLRNATYERPAR